MDPYTAVQPKWYDKKWLVVVLCIFFFPVGLYALWKNSEIGKGWKVAVTAIILVIVLLEVATQRGSSPSSDTSTSATATATSAATTESSPKVIGVGDVLKTEYFDVTVNNINVSPNVSTGNQFADLAAEAGNQYLILNVSFKNTDNESRMIFDGTVWITYNGKEYEFDKSETVMLDGWGVALEQINPLTTKTTNLVYKIPQEISGVAYWQPGRASKRERIMLGNVK